MTSEEYPGDWIVETSGPSLAELITRYFAAVDACRIWEVYELRQQIQDVIRKE